MVWAKLFGIGDLGREKFARLVAKMGRERGRFQDPVVDDEQFCIVDGENKLFLGNIHRTFLGHPRGARLAYLERAVLEKPRLDVPSWDEARSLLRPVLRHAGYLRMAELQYGSELISHEPFVGSLFSTLVIDAEHQMSLVGAAQLEAWKTSFADAFEIAVSNLRRVSDGSFAPVGRGLWVAPWADSYGAARLLCPELLQRVCTDPWVCAPDRDTIFVGDPAVPEAMVALLDLLERTADRPYGSSNQIYVLEDKELRPLAVANDDRVSARYRELLVREAMEVYDSERAAVPEDGPFYASYMAKQMPSGAIETLSTWSDGVDTLLPPTDFVVAMRIDWEGQKVTQRWEVPWDALVAEPDLLRCNDCVLPRWRTQRFPGDDWLDAHAREPSASA